MCLQINSIIKIYDDSVDWFEANRGRVLVEKKYLDQVIQNIPAAGKVLDLGTGIGLPIASYFSEKGFQVTGVDGSRKMIERARRLKPESAWLVADMRTLDLNEGFDAVIAWDSLFHLTQNEQRPMFERIARHLNPRGMLLFTSGPDAGESFGELNGFELYHASLSPDEYKDLLSKNRFDILDHKIEDPDCGGHTVWVARLK